MLIPLMEKLAFDGCFISTSNLQESAKEAQKILGDYIINIDENKAVSIEIKTEPENKYGNLFLEMWSNLSKTTPGWLVTCNADVLWYFFQKERELYQIDMKELKDWAFKRQCVFKYPEKFKMQRKYRQKNDTWGYCFPISMLMDELGDKMELIKV
jgi:hypothetical protein